MRLPLAVTGVLAVLLVSAPAAQAAAISLDYCDYSLRGGGSLAPDNEIRAEWDHIEAAGADIVSSYIYWYNSYSSGNDLRVSYRFVRAGGNVEHASVFRCWRDPLTSTGTYHDGILSHGH
jgi:hypothetical protein